MAFTGTLNRVERGQQYAGYANLTVMCCPECGVIYAIPEVLRAEACSQGGHKIEWCCPNGHNLGYPGESARQERDAARDQAASARARAEQAEASAATQKRAATRARNERNKARKRSADGVCPCCGRTFKQVQRHMATKHPDYQPTA